MHLSDQAKAAYGSARQTTRTPREIEFALFSEVTTALKTAAKPETPWTAVVDAVAHNRRLWNELAVLVADEKNALPAPLRAQLFYLSEFVNHHSSAVLRQDADVTPLIDVNVSIMKGLIAKSEEAA